MDSQNGQTRAKRLRLTAEHLRELLVYNKETGCFQWKHKGKGLSFTKIGNITPKGYIYISVNGARYMAHNLVWLYTYGHWPPSQLDHIDRNPANNRLDNLRPSNPSLNQYNRRRPAKGVFWHIKARKWQVQIGKKYLGLFETKKEALAVRQKALEELLPWLRQQESGG